jgi:hypothetical protein
MIHGLVNAYNWDWKMEALASSLIQEESDMK